MVALVDDLESQGLVQRERSITDRRQYALHLTTAERDTLADLLDRIAQQQGLTPGVHPGYPTMG